MVMQFDIATGEMVRTKQLDSLPSSHPKITPAPLLRLMAVDEATLIQTTTQRVPGALMTHLDAARIDD